MTNGNHRDIHHEFEDAERSVHNTHMMTLALIRMMDAIGRAQLLLTEVNERKKS